MVLKGSSSWQRFAIVLVLSVFALVQAEDPYRFFNWNVTYGDIYPLGVRQQVCKLLFRVLHKLFLGLADLHRLCYSLLQGILINGQFPGPDLYSVTNDNLIINVYNNLDEPFLLSW